MTSSLTYFKNFDDSEFEKNKPREFNKLRFDDCDITQRNYSNNKTLKFTTTTFRDLVDAQRVGNYFAMDIDNQLFVPSSDIDRDSKLRHGNTGNILTNFNVRHDLGELPLPTVPYRGQLFHGNVLIEDNMRNYLGINKQSCNPKDTQFYNRSFYIFDGCIDKPNPLDSVEHTLRCGTSTRYQSGVKKGKNFRFPVNVQKIQPVLFESNKFEYSLN